MKKWLTIMIPAVLVVILLGYTLGSRIIPSAALDNFANAASAPSDMAELNDAAVATVDGNDLSTADAANASLGNDAAADNGSVSDVAPAADVPVAPAAAAPAQSPDDGADEDSDADAQGQREIGRAIRSATLEALESGQPVHWHRDGLQGDVTVSRPSWNDEGVCRTVSATMGTEDDPDQSGDHIWCQPATGGPWTPQ